jgi:phage shock protein PspC (stress-responsive transcriptional regulator)
MKKTLTVNLNGRVFNIDEDAYQLLDNYLKNLRIYFRNEEGHIEILADFEARIEELLSNRIRLGHNVINIEEVEKVIAQMGRPNDFGGNEENEENEKNEGAKKGKDLYITVKKRLYRNPDDKMIGGVFSGIAAYFNWDVLVLRIIATILVFVSTGWIVPVYLLVWLITPEAKTAEQKLEMQGKPITVENIGKTVAATAEETKTKNNGCLVSLVDFIAAFFKVCLVGLACLIGLPLLFALVIVILVLFATIFGTGTGIIGSILPWSKETLLLVDHPESATIGFCFVLGIPLVALVYAIIAHLFKLRPVHKGVKWAGLIAWIIALVLFATSGFKVNWDNIHVNWHYSTDTVEIQGNGIIADRMEQLPSVKFIELNGPLDANIQIEQVKNGETSLLINGDSNLIDKVTVEVEEDGNLVLSTENDYHLKSISPLIIRLQTADLKGVKIKTIGNVNLIKTLETDTFFIKTEGAGKFQADSLYSNVLKVETEGVGSVILSGRTKRASFELEGAGKIDALELVADSVYARLDGVGSIQCNPVQHLDGNVNGVGKISYKKEPKTKNSGVFGIGKIGLE